MNVDQLITACQSASGPDDIVRIVQTFIGQDDLDELLGPCDRATYRFLHQSPDLTVMHLVIPPTPLGAPHEHGMPAVIGVYSGHETNQLYTRVENGVVPADRIVLAPGDVRAFPDGTVHAVHSDGAYVAAVHVYLGDLVNTPRSTWDPDGVEGPLDESFLPHVFARWQELEKVHGRPLTEAEVLESVAELMGGA